MPPHGRRNLRSRVESTSTITGWAIGACSLPVQATVMFRAIENNIPLVEISAPATPPTAIYRSAANIDLFISVANLASETPITLTVDAYDNEGRRVGSGQITLCGLCQQLFALGSLLPSLPESFEGSVVIASSPSPAMFVAWALNSDRGLLSSLPSGAADWPAAHYDRIWLIYQKLRHAALRMFPNVDHTPIRLRVGAEPVINAFARADGLVQINLALAQLISDSPSELAFVIGHELGHAIQFRMGRSTIVYSQNREIDADIIGMMLAVAAGYDPYGAAGALGKLAMATKRTGLLAQLFDDLLDPHTSFTNRMGVVFDTLTLACAQPGIAQFCAEYRNYFHPNFPANMPLALPGAGVQAAAASAK